MPGNLIQVDAVAVEFMNKGGKRLLVGRSRGQAVA
jgi:hypothetical protein